MLRRNLLQAAALGAALPVAAAAQPARLEGGKVTVYTGLQATYSIASALAAGTNIEVRNLPPAGSSMEGLARALARQSADTLSAATAVVGIGKLWPDDPLYPAVRGRNITVVNIDAAFPWEHDDTGVQVIAQPADDADWVKGEAAEVQPASRYVWLSLPNGIRMAELVAADFARLAPNDAAKVRANLAAFSERFRNLKADYEAKFTALANARVFALANEFVYLFADMGLFVDGLFTRQDLDWKPADYAGLTRHLKDRGVKVVVHKWKPDAKVEAAVTAAGAKLVVLDAGDTERETPLAADGYQTLLAANLEALAKALG